MQTATRSGKRQSQSPDNWGSFITLDARKLTRRLKNSYREHAACWASDIATVSVFRSSWLCQCCRLFVLPGIITSVTLPVSRKICRCVSALFFHYWNSHRAMRTRRKRTGEWNSRPLLLWIMDLHLMSSVYLPLCDRVTTRLFLHRWQLSESLWLSILFRAVNSCYWGLIYPKRFMIQRSIVELLAYLDYLFFTPVGQDVFFIYNELFNNFGDFSDNFSPISRLFEHHWYGFWV